MTEPAQGPDGQTTTAAPQPRSPYHDLYQDLTDPRSPAPPADDEDHPGPPPPPYEPRRGTGFADPGLIAGRSARMWVYIGVLTLAAAADLANFYQIIQFALRDQGDLLFISADVLLAITVVGFTACVLFLAHISGVMLRDRRAEETWVPAVLPWLCLFVWAGLGLAGLYLRLTTDTEPPTQAPIVITGQSPTSTTSASPSTLASPAPEASQSPVLSGSPGAAADSDESASRTLGSSVVFLGLYLGTGLVALVGGYLTHNPAHAALVRARRRESRAVGAAADAASEYELARGEVERLEQLNRHAELITRADWIELQYHGEVLKWEARLRAASRTQNPGFTDAWVPPPTGPDQPPASQRPASS